MVGARLCLGFGLGGGHHLGPGQRPGRQPGGLTFILIRPGRPQARLDRGARQPERVHRLPRQCWEIWALNYDYLFGSGDHNQPTLDLASEFPTATERRHLAGRQGLDDPHTGAASSSGWGAAHCRRRGLHLQLRHQERHDAVHDSIQPESSRPRRSTRPRCSSPARTRWPWATWRPQSVPILPEHIWKHVSPQAAASSYGNKPPDHRQRPLRDGGLRQGQLHEMVRNPYWWGQKPAIDKIYFETYQNAETMVSDLAPAGSMGPGASRWRSSSSSSR